MTAHNELTESAMTDRLRRIARLIGGGARPRLEIRIDGAAIYLDQHRPVTPSHEGPCVEDVLTCAYEALMRVAADEQADGVGQGRAA